MTSKASVLALAACAGFLGTILLIAPAQAAMSKDEIKAEVEKIYGVSVLHMTETEVAGKPALAVKVMNKGGNDNRAFQVNTLLIDPDTGHLMSVYRPLPDGFAYSDVLPNNPNKQPSDLLSSPDAHPWR